MQAVTLADKAVVLGIQNALLHTRWPPSLASQCRRDGLETLTDLCHLFKTLLLVYSQT